MVERGHRLVPHTADLIVEAWAPTRSECLAEAVLAVVSSVTTTTEVPTTEPLEFRIDAGADPDLLLGLLEEAVYVIDVIGVPVGVWVHETEDGGLAGTFDIARFSDVEQTGPAPKAVTRHELSLDRRGDTWHARAVIDV